MGQTLLSDDLTQLWPRAQATVAAFIGAMVPDFHAAQDLMQEVAVAVVEDFAHYDPARPFNGWVIGVAKNKVLAYWRRKGIGQVVFDSEAVERMAAVAERLDEDATRLGAALEHCLAKLPARSRRLLEMRYQNDLKPAEIAARVGAGTNAVTVTLHRVREALRQCVKRRVGGKQSVP